MSGAPPMMKRSNPWLAELQQEAFVEINPKAANDRGIRNGDYVWLKTPPMAAMPDFKGLRVKAQVTERVGPDTVFMPFHWGDLFGPNQACNYLTIAATDTISKQPELKFCAVAVEKAPAAVAEEPVPPRPAVAAPLLPALAAERV